MEQKTIQVIYKCYVGNLESDKIIEHLETEKKRVEKSINVDNQLKYNVTVIPMRSDYSSIETLPTYL